MIWSELQRGRSRWAALPNPVVAFPFAPSNTPNSNAKYRGLWKHPKPARVQLIERSSVRSLWRTHRLYVRLGAGTPLAGRSSSRLAIEIHQDR